MTGKRGAAYYRARLRRDHPTIFADLSSGKFVSVREAAAAAGLIRLPSRVDALKREWKKAKNEQQAEFVKWLTSGAYKRVGLPIADAKGRLRRDVSDFLLRWVAQRGFNPARVMKEIGFSGYDPTFRSAISSDGPLRAEVIPELARWLKKQGFR
jgi:hypothetical protein